MPYFKNHNLLFIHIPKTGGSNIENFFFHYLKEKPTLLHLISNNLELRINNHSLQHMTYNELYKNKEYFDIDFKKSRIITVVRNPYDRIISDLFWYKLISKNNSVYEIELEIKKYLTSDFLYDNHKLPQYKFLINDEQSRIINQKIIVLKCETLNENMKQLGFQQFSDFCDKLTKSSFNKDYSQYLNKESIKMINDYYYEDFVRFKYKML